MLTLEQALPPVIPLPEFLSRLPEAVRVRVTAQVRRPDVAGIVVFDGTGLQVGAPTISPFGPGCCHKALEDFTDKEIEVDGVTKYPVVAYVKQSPQAQ